MAKSKTFLICLLLLFFSISFILYIIFLKKGSIKSGDNMHTQEINAELEFSHQQETYLDFEVIEPEETGCMDELDTKCWKTFKSVQLGLDFKFPQSYTIFANSGNQKTEEGDRLTISVMDNDNSIIEYNFTNENFAFKWDEGCCYYFADKPVDLSLSEKELANKLEKFNPFGLEKIRVNNKEAIKFFSIFEYSHFTGYKNALLPHNKNNYTNLMITSQALYSLSIDDYDNNKEQTKKMLENKILLNDDDINKNIKEYDIVLDSTVFY